MDPHDRSHQLTIAYNTAYGTHEKHGIIVSREVDRSFIVGNVVFRNRGSGFMLDRDSTANIIYANTAFDNDQDGITLFESSCNLIMANHFDRQQARGHQAAQQLGRRHPSQRDCPATSVAGSTATSPICALARRIKRAITSSTCTCRSRPSWHPSNDHGEATATGVTLAGVSGDDAVGKHHTTEAEAPRRRRCQQHHTEDACRCRAAQWCAARADRKGRPMPVRSAI